MTQFSYSWHKIFSTKTEAEQKIPLYGSFVITLQNEEICIFRNLNGFYAIENICPHQKLPLTGSECDDKDLIRCSFHFLPINLRTGKCNSPCYDPVKIFALKIEDDGFYIEI
jgi:nitrite reductase/ring-hydroxylating ferredoxin subunit